MHFPNRVNLVGCLLGLTIALTACAPPTATPLPTLTPTFPLVATFTPESLLPNGRTFLMGTLPTPSTGQSFDGAYAEAAQYAEWVPIWGRPTPFYALTDDVYGDWGKTFIGDLTLGNGMLPLMHVSFMGPNLTLSTPPDLPDATLADPAWRQAYVQAVLNMVHRTKPAYLSVGNEVNRWFEKYGADESDPNGFQNFVSLYEQIYDLVKPISPDTKVFVTFAREIVSEHREANLDVLDMFDPSKMDLLVLTSYPHAVQGINAVADIPDDYYAKAALHMPGKSIGFSEVAWPSLDAFGGEHAQAQFLIDLVGRLTTDQGLDLQLLGWPWLHDQTQDDYTGLIRPDGTQKLAYQVWKMLSEARNLPVRAPAIPATQTKMIPADDIYKPVVHDDAYAAPHALEGPINSAGYEDSPFITPDGKQFFFFTPDANIPPQKQLLDGVTGIWWSEKLDGAWTQPLRVVLNDDLSLDGCETAFGNDLWFCSARAGNLGEIDFYIAHKVDGWWNEWENAGAQINVDYAIGEMHLGPDANTIYFAMRGEDSYGDADLYSSQLTDGQWSKPVNLGPGVNSAKLENQPFVTNDGQELWFTRESTLGFTGPAVYRSVRQSDGSWGQAEEIVSNFAGEPTLDDDGNVYFVHHFMSADGHLRDADIYVAEGVRP